MRLTVSDLSVPGPSTHHELLVPPTGFVARSGEVTLVGSAPGVSVTALALALGGAIRLASGSVHLEAGEQEVDGEAGGAPRPVGGPAGLRAGVVLVDVEGVTAPEDALSVVAVMREQLDLARVPAGRRDVRRVLEAHAVTEPGQRWDHLPAGVRTPMLLDVASRRPGAVAVVLAGPDRHGGSPHDWYGAARAVASRGPAVVVVCTPESAAAATLNGAVA